MSIAGTGIFEQKSFLISGTHSGVGKTTASFILMSLLKKSGFNVQPFKHGPDFIDPGYHRLATGKESINLDQWMMDHHQIQDAFKTVRQQGDVGIVEGMGAVFDGENGTRKGSDAELSSILSIPTILVVDISGMTQSINAVLQGFFDYDPHLQIIGIIFNRAGSQKHYEMVENSLLPRFKSLSLGYLLRSDLINIPERHLGLLTLEENDSMAERCKPYLEIAQKTLKLDYLTKALESAETLPNSIQGQKPHIRPQVRIGIAKDQAFCFYYKLNLLALEDAGAELVYFSPLQDASLPEDIDGIYLGGGYPENFGKELSQNPLTKQILREAISGMPIYAECGGFIYLCQDLQYENHLSYPMAGVFPYTIRWDKNYLAIKYVKIKTSIKSILGPVGVDIRGQEFHQTRVIDSNHYHENTCYMVTSSAGECFSEGYVKYNVLGSYMHLYFPSNPNIAENFVRSCKKYQNEKTCLSNAKN